MTKSEKNKIRNKELRAYFAELEILCKRLEKAHVLHFQHDDGTYYFLPVGEEVEVYWECDGEPPHLYAVEPKATARARYKKLLSEDFAPTR